MAETDTRIHNMLHKVAKDEELQDYEIKLKPISSGGANYTSTLYVATISSTNKDDLELFIKVAAWGEKMRSTTDMNVFKMENFVYTELQSKFRKLEDKHGVTGNDRVAMSKFYAAITTPNEEMMVLENLFARGFGDHDRMKSVDWEYAAAAIRELAKFHALSMGIQHEDPEDFKKLVDFFKLEVFKSGDMDGFFENSKNNALKAVRKENYERLNNFLKDQTTLGIWDQGQALNREVLVHGDYRPSNMLHRVRHDGTVEIVPVDYQTVRGGCPVSDLLYFIFLGTDKQFRDQYYERLVAYYYTELCAALTRLGMDPEEKYPKKIFQEELREKLPYGLGITILVLPIVTVETENAPVVDEDMDVASFTIEKTGNNYPERLNGVVDDFIRLGVI